MIVVSESETESAQVWRIMYSSIQNNLVLLVLAFRSKNKEEHGNCSPVVLDTRYKSIVNKWHKECSLQHRQLWIKKTGTAEQEITGQCIITELSVQVLSHSSERKLFTTDRSFRFWHHRLKYSSSIFVKFYKNVSIQTESGLPAVNSSTNILLAFGHVCLNINCCYTRWMHADNHSQLSAVNI